MSGFQRTGRWTVPKRFDCFVFWGGGEIDLREAVFADREVVINCVAVMGGMTVIVPPGVEVVVRGLGIMGGFDHREEGVPGDPGAPRVIVTGFAFWGGVGVERKPARAEERRLKEERRRERLERKAERKRLRDSVRQDVAEAHRRMLEDHRRMLEEHRDPTRGPHGVGAADDRRERERRRDEEG